MRYSLLIIYWFAFKEALVSTCNKLYGWFTFVSYISGSAMMTILSVSLFKGFTVAFVLIS